MILIGLKRGTVKLVPHNHKWAKLFQIEKKRLQNGLGYQVEAIEHIGSTAVNRMLAKPIIDIAVGIASMRDSKKLVNPLKKLGYEWRQHVGGPHVRLFFAKGPESKRTHYIHLLKYNGEIWKDQIAFRDYLKLNRQVALRYNKLKELLEKKFKDNRTYYTAAKTKFIHSIFKKARKMIR